MERNEQAALLAEARGWLAGTWIGDGDYRDAAATVEDAARALVLAARARDGACWDHDAAGAAAAEKVVEAARALLRAGLAAVDKEGA